MKKIVVLFSLLISIPVLMFGQTKSQVEILDKSSRAYINSNINMVTMSLSLNSVICIMDMNPALVSKAASGPYKNFSSLCLEILKLNYSNPDFLSPIAVKFCGSDCLIFCIATTSVFNKAKFSERQLAMRICSDEIIPRLMEINDAY